MKRVMITGAGGLLGSQVAKLLVQRGVQTYGLVRKEVATPLEGVSYVVADLTSESLESKLPNDLDGIMHLAQSSSYRDFPAEATDIFDVNVVSTFRLLEYARKIGVRKFVFASSGGVYEDSQQPRSESSNIGIAKDLGFYLGTKASGENLCLGYSEYFEMTILRPFFIYGPGQKPGMLIPRIAQAVMNESPVKIDPPEGVRLNPVYVADAAKAAIAALDYSGGIIANLAGPEIITLMQLTKLIGKILDKEVRFELTGRQPQNLSASIEIMSQKLAKPETGVEDGLVVTMSV